MTLYFALRCEKFVVWLGGVGVQPGLNPMMSNADMVKKATGSSPPPSFQG